MTPALPAIHRQNKSRKHGLLRLPASLPHPADPTIGRRRDDSECRPPQPKSINLTRRRTMKRPGKPGTLQMRNAIEKILRCHSCYYQIVKEQILSAKRALRSIQRNRGRARMSRNRPQALWLSVVATFRSNAAAERQSYAGVCRSSRIRQEKIKNLSNPFRRRPAGRRRRWTGQWRRPGTIRQPPACKAGALPIELRPRRESREPRVERRE